MPMRKASLRRSARSLGAMAACGVKSMWAYRFNALTGIVFDLIGIAVPLLVWNALFHANGGMPVQGKTLSDLMTYTIIARAATLFVSTGLADDISDRVHSGSIILDFMKPQSPLMGFVGRSLGNSLYSVAFRGLPLLALALFVPGMQPPFSLYHFVFFLFALALGFVLDSLLQMIFGMVAFWQIDVGIIGWFTSVFYMLLSGSVVPLWFLPDWLKAVAGWLPFQAAYYLPVTLYMGHVPLAGVGAVFLTQLGWIAALLLLQRLIWRFCVRRVVIAGG